MSEPVFHYPGAVALALLAPAIERVRVSSQADWMEEAALTITDRPDGKGVTLTVTVTLTDQEQR